MDLMALSMILMACLILPLPSIKSYFVLRLPKILPSREIFGMMLIFFLPRREHL
jgi:hypothetical protein